MIAAFYFRENKEMRGAFKCFWNVYIILLEKLKSVRYNNKIYNYANFA